MVESLGEIDKAKRNVVVKKKLHVHYWIHGLPLRMRFPKSKLYESIFTPIINWPISWFHRSYHGNRRRVYFSACNDLYN